MRFGFSTMGDPGLDLAGHEALAREFAMDFIELRCLEGTLDLPGVFARHGMSTPAIPVRIVCSSLELADASPDEIATFLSFARLAHDLRAPWVRVFGSRRWPVDEFVLRDAARTADTLRQAMRAGNLETSLILETHGCFSAPQLCASLNERLEDPLDILWDSHHTWKLVGEPLAQSWRTLQPFIRQVHYKDSLPTPQGHSYVPPGGGSFPTRELFALLADNHFQGGLCLEWEKLWKPEIAPLRDALAAFRAQIDSHFPARRSTS